MISSPYRTIRAVGEDQFVAQKSRFIGAVSPIATEEDASFFLTQRKKQDPDARHHVFAYTLHEQQILRCSDDGEPQGTAGHPILDVLLQEKLWNVCVVVTRYFGGVLLGTGGLVRAYTHAAKLALLTQPPCLMQWCIHCALVIDYAMHGTMMHLLARHELTVTDVDFGERIRIQLQVPQTNMDALLRALQERFAGKVSLTPMREGYVAC